MENVETNIIFKSHNSAHINSLRTCLYIIAVLTGIHINPFNRINVILVNKLLLKSKTT